MVWEETHVRGFESRHRILEKHFSHICCQNFNGVCLRRPKIYDKRGLGWPIFLKLLLHIERENAF